MQVNITFKNGDQLILTTIAHISLYPHKEIAEPPEVILYTSEYVASPECIKLEDIVRIGVTE